MKLDILEEISQRRDYKLVNVWGCYTCFNDRDPLADYVTAYCDNGIHQRCTKDHITKPHRVCNRCGTNYPLKKQFCDPCEYRLTQIVTFEREIEKCNEEIEELRYKSRKRKTPNSTFLKEIDSLIQKGRELEDILEEINNSKPLHTGAGVITRIVR
jgi:ribosomal protein L37E